jgi:hypothetical protein|tara:strand:- start:348 stop:698 length:351 start_codon:yes stop_codon:yes gene_type:complete
MAQSIEEIKAELEAPTHTIVNGERVDLTSEEIEATLDTWAENERARQLDVEANGYKTYRVQGKGKDEVVATYPPLGEQLDKLWHDIDGGKLGADAKTGSWYLAIKQVKDDNPKPGE